MTHTNEKSTIYQKVFDIHDQTMGVLRSMQIPPYPINYKKYFDEVFLELADAELKRDQQDAEHKILNAPKDDLTKYLDIAQRSVMSFVESHANIASVAKMQREYVDQAPESTLERCITFIEGLTALNQEMSAELDKAQVQIGTLTAELHEAVASLTTDPLTKVGNRKAFMDDMDAAIQAGMTQKLPMVVMMIDADNFKFLNDEYGHLAGDRVLYFIAQSIKTMIRDSDKVYRYGGEEFAVIMNQCDESQAYAYADKIRTKIEQSNLLYQGKSIRLTVSIGVTIHQKGDDFDTILGRADKALYCAKKSHKNCTVLFDWQ